MKRYLYIYMLFFVWSLYDGLVLKFGFGPIVNSFWHIGVLVFIFYCIQKELPARQKAVNVSFISFLIVIFIKILLNLIAAFGADYQKYNSFVNNAYVDFGVLIFIFIVHFSLGLKKWSK